MGAGVVLNTGIDITVDYAYRAANYFDANHAITVKIRILIYSKHFEKAVCQPFFIIWHMKKLFFSLVIVSAPFAQNKFNFELDYSRFLFDDSTGLLELYYGFRAMN